MLSRSFFPNFGQEPFPKIAGKSPGLKVIKLEYILRLKIKRNDRLLADTCLQAANHYTRFFL